MRKHETIERLYLDFDGFFASVEQQARPALRGKPVGVVPFDNVTTTCVIAASKEAKHRGVKNIVNVVEVTFNSWREDWSQHPHTKPSGVSS